MNPGKLNHRITIIQDINRGSNITDDNGAPIENWHEVKKAWCNKKGLSGRTFYAAQAVNAETDVIFTLRYDKSIKTFMRITDDEGEYKIKALVDKEGNRRYWTITASIIEAGS